MLRLAAVRATLLLPSIIIGGLLLILGCNDRTSPPSTIQPNGLSGAPSNQVTRGASVSQPRPLELQPLGFGNNGIQLNYEATYVGATQCATCHEHYCASQASHHMARTGAWVTAENQNRYFSPARLGKEVQTPPGVPPCQSKYDSTPDGIRLVTQFGSNIKLPIAKVDAVFGSQARAMGPIAFEDGRRLRELPVSYSTALDGWIRTPGQPIEPSPAGIVNSVEQTAQCLSCHATILAWDKDRLDPQATILGISCERCHGPGSAHIEAVRHRASDLKIFNAGRLAAQGQVSFCAQCHRTAADASPFEILTGDKEVARHAGLGLMLSACYRKPSHEARLSCLDCHSPHENIQRTSDNFNASCLRCHTVPARVHATLQVTASSDCVSCHMKKVEDVIAGAAFTSHWIRKPPDSFPLVGKEQADCLDYLETLYRERIAEAPAGSQQLRDAQMNLAEVLLDKNQIEAALEIYRGFIPPQDFPMVRLGVCDVLLKHGRGRLAVEQLRAAVRDMPQNLLTANALAWALATVDDAQIRKGTEAVTLAEELVGLTRRQSPEALDTLAAAQAETGQFPDATRTAGEALDLCRLSGNAELATAIRGRIDLYQKGVAFHDPKTTPKSGGDIPLHFKIQKAK